MVDGALGSTYGWGYTLYYATNFIFTGLAVSDRIPCADVQHRWRGSGHDWRAWRGAGLLYHPLAPLVAGLAGRNCWRRCLRCCLGCDPCYLQAKRGSHIVITTIMFNFIAAALLNYLLHWRAQATRVLWSLQPQIPRSRPTLPSLHDMLGLLGISIFKAAPANIPFFVAIFACVCGLGADLAHQARL